MMNELTFVRSWKICSSIMEMETMRKKTVAMAQVGVCSREMEVESPAAMLDQAKTRQESKEFQDS